MFLQYIRTTPMRSSPPIPRRLLVAVGLVLVTLAAGASVLSVSTAQALTATVYVDKDSVGGACSDARSASQANSPSTPWCSLGRAVAAAPAGSDVVVRRGSYPYLEILNQRRTAYVTFKSYPGETVALPGGLKVQGSSYFRFQDLKFNSSSFHTSLFTSDHIQVLDSEFSPRGMIVRATKHSLIANNTIHDLSRTAGKPAPDGYGMWANGYWNGGSQDNIVDLTIRGNRFLNIPNDAIQLGGGPSRVFDVTIEDNEFAGVRRRVDTDHCDPIQVIGGDGVTIRSNSFRDSEVALMIKDATTKDLIVENNLMIGADGGGITAQLWDTPGARVINNTIWASRLGGLRFADDPKKGGTPYGIVVRNNVVDKYTNGSSSWIAEQDHNLILSGPRTSTDLATAPVFTTGWRLASGSPGVDAASTTGAPPVDRLDQARMDDPNTRNTGAGTVGYYDMGAHELQAGTAPAPEPTPTPTPSPTPPPTSSPSPAPVYAAPELRMYSDAARTSDALLDGQAVEGGIYVHAKADGASKVEFRIDDPQQTGAPYRSEIEAPFDLQGGNNDGTAIAYDTTKLEDGPHTLTATASYPDGSSQVTSAKFDVRNVVYDMRFSTSSDRSGSVRLAGSTVRGNVYAFAVPDAGVTKVAFHLDDPNRTRTPWRVENNAPWDFNGGNTTLATAYDTRKLSNGSHTITAGMTLTNGTVKVVSATFTVAN